MIHAVADMQSDSHFLDKHFLSKPSEINKAIFTQFCAINPI